MSSRPLLLAGIRVTGGQPHLGTYYGWIRPVADAARNMDVVVLVADFQSLDPLPKRPMRELAAELEAALRSHLPPQVPIIRESAIPSLPTLARLAIPLFAEHHWRRVAPLRKIHRTGQTASVATMLYPAMMIADSLAIGATHVLAKPEGRFQHIDLLNEILARGAQRYKWPATRLTTHAKPRVDIRASDGAGPMKRDRPGFLPIDADVDEVTRWASTLETPGSVSAGIDRQAHCRIAWPLWQATAAGKANPAPETKRLIAVRDACVSNRVRCRDCVRRLAAVISGDLTEGRQPNDVSLGHRTELPRMAAGLITARAELTARNLIRDSLKGLNLRA